MTIIAAPDDVLAVEIYREPEPVDSDVRIKIPSPTVPSLSAVIPPFSACGLEVVDERNYADRGVDNKRSDVNDLGLRIDIAEWSQPDSTIDTWFIDAVRAVRTVRIESDRLNSLVPSAGLVGWLRDQ